jgi:hypothetical protein
VVTRINKSHHSAVAWPQTKNIRFAIEIMARRAVFCAVRKTMRNAGRKMNRKERDDKSTVIL